MELVVLLQLQEFCSHFATYILSLIASTFCHILLLNFDADFLLLWPAGEGLTNFFSLKCSGVKWKISFNFSVLTSQNLIWNKQTNKQNFHSSVATHHCPVHPRHHGFCIQTCSLFFYMFSCFIASLCISLKCHFQGMAPEGPWYSVAFRSIFPTREFRKDCIGWLILLTDTLCLIFILCQCWDFDWINLFMGTV